jgi:hypothetical protein
MAPSSGHVLRSERKYFEQTTQSLRSEAKVPGGQYTIAPVARADSVDDGSKVIIDLRPEPQPTNSAPSEGPSPVVKLPTAPERTGSGWVVVLAYVIAATALALAIYERFLR